MKVWVHRQLIFILQIIGLHIFLLNMFVCTFYTRVKYTQEQSQFYLRLIQWNCGIPIKSYKIIDGTVVIFTMYIFNMFGWNNFSVLFFFLSVFLFWILYVVYIISCHLYSSFRFQALRGFCNMRYKLLLLLCRCTCILL